MLPTLVKWMWIGAFVGGLSGAIFHDILPRHVKLCDGAGKCVSYPVITSCDKNGKNCEDMAVFACPEGKTCFSETPFDVPPVETDGPDTNADINQNACSGDVTWDGQSQWCEKKVHHRACADKSRFLLMSEDGKWHCLALGAKP
jgi:hypothetical protein